MCWDCLHAFVDLDTAQFNLAVNQVNNGGNFKSSTKKEHCTAMCFKDVHCAAPAWEI